jgi:type II secretory pathway component PulK
MSHPQQLCRRAGAALAIALVVLIVAAAMAIGLTRLLVARHRVQMTQERHLQVIELARAGIDRARAQVARSEDYQGETWNVSAEQLRGEGEGTVELVVTLVDDSPALRRITARAAWGADEHRVQHTREMVVDRNTLTRK